MFHLVKPAFAAALALSILTPATAQITGHSGFSDIQFSVQDLTPADDRIAGFEFGPRTSHYTASYHIGWGNTDSVVVDPVLPVPVHRALQSQGAVVEFYSDGAGSLASSFGVDPELDESYDLASTASQVQTILLKAHTALTVGGNAYSFLNRSNVTFREHTTDFSSRIGASLDFISLAAPRQHFQQEFALAVDERGDNSIQEFSFSAVNNNDYDIEIALSFNVSTAYEGATVSAVPEPGSWLMLGVGVLVLAGRGWGQARVTRLREALI
ncbi:PEP-CTERM sorting domain-containing protein [Pseudoduganella dura]|uniref:PEP-CTERM sorting domain-containing protein n=1 Tax=Pseudoduganella dura TaxID=321982 RepID=UPI0012DAE283|nr:PEP-CTERM sorting domain-containing protein [Pseudoduganella dura]GGY03403.1 hypothetical protein GCM10007386_37910 [Pseudoduganella dura]